MPELTRKEMKCLRSGHKYEEFIDPESGGYMRCLTCGKVVDCEDPDGDEGNL